MMHDKAFPMKKPRIYSLNGYWVCTYAQCKGFGDTPEQAYESTMKIYYGWVTYLRDQMASKGRKAKPSTFRLRDWWPGK